MDSPRPISVRDRPEAGFTLVELLIAASLMLVLGLGVISAYLFLGRNFTRLGNTQQQDVKARRALFYFTQDVSSATAFTSTVSANLTMTVPATFALANCATTSGSKNVTCTSTTGLSAGLTVSGSGIPTDTTVTSVTNGTTFVLSANANATTAGQVITAYTSSTVSYLYDSSSGTLSRVAGGVTTTLLTDIDSTATTPANGFVYYNQSGTAVTAAASVKSVEFAFTTKVGTANIGTQSSYRIVSPRVIARNKQFLP